MKLSTYVKHLKSDLRAIFDDREAESHLNILLQHVLNLSRVDRLLNAEMQLDEKSMKKIDQLLVELRKQKPIEYILNESIFWGFPFYVDENVLIPRSETEELVMLFLENEKESNISVLDIGTGSGCIPLAIALEKDYHQIEACDVSVEALKVAQKNVNRHQVKVALYELNILKENPPITYDVVISNPPYVKEEEIVSLQKKVKEYEPLIALTPFGDPLKFYKRMIDQVNNLLKPGGRFYWEIHEDLGQEVLQLFNDKNFTNVELIEDMYGRNRMVKAKWLG